MPTYEYRCTDCGHDFDIVQAFTDDSLTVCPECGGHLKKVFGSVGISFKGSGFYVNDSGSAKHSTHTSSSSESTGGSESSSNDSSSTSDSTKTSKKSDSSKTSASKSKAKAAAD